jgi:hypothetical protein
MAEHVFRAVFGLIVLKKVVGSAEGNFAIQSKQSRCAMSFCI